MSDITEVQDLMVEGKILTKEEALQVASLPQPIAPVDLDDPESIPF